MALTNKSSCFGVAKILRVVLALGLLASNASSPRLLISFELFVREMHEQWMSRYGLVYKDDAEEERFKILKQNLEFIEAFNKLNRGFFLRLDAFADLTNEEFQAFHTGCKRPLKQQTSSNLTPSNFTDVPAALD